MPFHYEPVIMERLNNFAHQETTKENALSLFRT